jgi:hypothetical protein
MDITTARGIAARIWCDQDFEKYVMNTKLAEKIARLIMKEANLQDAERQIKENIHE